MHSNAPLAFSSMKRTRVGKKAYHCPTCQCTNHHENQNQNLHIAESSKNQDLPKRVSGLFESRFLGASGDNISKDKITWFKSYSPKPKNIVFRFVSPPKTLTHSLEDRRRSLKASKRRKEIEEEIVTTPRKEMKKSRVPQTQSTIGMEAQRQERKHQSSEHFSFQNYSPYSKQK